MSSSQKQLTLDVSIASSVATKSISINSRKIIYFLTDKSGENTTKTGPNQRKNNFEMCCEP